MKKDKQTIDVLQDLTTILDKLLTTLRREYQIEVNILDQHNWINMISTRTPEVLIEMLLVTLERLRVLDVTEKFEVIGEKTIHIDMNPWYFLIFDLPELEKKYQSGVSAVCHWIIFALFARRLLLYINKHPNSKDELYIKSATSLGKNPEAINDLVIALNNVSRKVIHLHETRTGTVPYPVGRQKNSAAEAKDNTTPEMRLHSLVWQIANEVPPNDLKQYLIMATKRNISSIPKRVSNKLIDEYRKQDKSRMDIKVRKYKKEKEVEFGTKYDGFKSGQSVESIPDVSKLREVEKVSDLARWIESRKDPIDREIGKLQLDNPEITVRQIADRLSLSKSDVDRRIQKLKKLKPPF